MKLRQIIHALDVRGRHLSANAKLNFLVIEGCNKNKAAPAETELKQKSIKSICFPAKLKKKTKTTWRIIVVLDGTICR